jgi:ubiquinone/menaquinone biosynthesis C-methylase UbiE
MPYDSELYDLVTPQSLAGDVEWYVRQAREAGGPVLELGAGTGRVTLAIARAGVSICAVDADDGMLNALREKVASEEEVYDRVSVLKADMRSFHVGRIFSLVIIPFRAFLHNLTKDDQLACLRCVHEQLQPGGRLAFNVYHPSLEIMARHTGPLEGVWRWAATYPTPDGGCVVRSESNRYDTVRQRVHSNHRYERYDAAGNLTRTFLHRLELACLYPGEITRLLEQSGFTDIRIDGDFTGRPFERDTDELVIEARKN